MGSYWKTVGSLWDFTRNPLGLVMDPKRIPLGIPRGLPLYSKFMPFRFQRDANGFQSIFNRGPSGFQCASNESIVGFCLDAKWTQLGCNGIPVWVPMGVWLDANPVLVGFLCDSNVVPMAPNRIPRGFQLHP